MAKIKIEPESLEATSHKISALKLRIAQLENELLKAGNTAPSYEGQFKPRVLGLSTQAKSQVSQRITTLDTQAARLEKIAKRFMEADNFFIGSKAWWLFLKNIIFNDPIKLLGFLSPKVMSQIGSFLVLGSLFIFLPTNNLTKKIFHIGLINISSKDSSKPDTGSGSVPNSGGNATIEEPQEPEPKPTVFPNNVGESVKPNNGGPAELGYSTYGGSNCTWFVAQAVLFTSGGKIQIREWSGAGNWRRKAVEEMEKGEAGFVTGIDKEPKIGDIYYAPPGGENAPYPVGHVAYVEKIEGEGANRVVTLVEEHYGRTTSAWPQAQSETIIIDGKPQRRWRVKVKLNTLINPPYNAEFIHLRY